MSEDEQRLSREELLIALDTGWGKFLAALAGLSDQEQARYVRQQGYPRRQDLLAHVCAWWEETFRAVPILLGGQSPAYDYADVDTFNAQAVARYGAWTPAGVQAEFERLRAELATLIAELPDVALENDEIYAWILNGAIEHYEEHRPPNGPIVR